MADRVVVFVDYQNTYRGARRAFEGLTASHVMGQFDPSAVGRAIADRVEGRTLAEVRVYAGMPDSRKDSRANNARSRQIAAWAKLPNVKTTWRPLRYPKDFGKDPSVKPEEKGIDVQLAIDFVMMAYRDEYDVGVIFSADTDLRPPLYAVEEIQQARGRGAIEVASWQPDRGYGNRLSIGSKNNRRPFCHFLDRAVYEAAQDRRDYNKRSDA